MKNKRVRAEVVRLFGEPLVRLADMTDPAGLDLSAALMDRVHDGADAVSYTHLTLPTSDLV